jgi:parallel beta-helix repeat protein
MKLVYVRWRSRWKNIGAFVFALEAMSLICETQGAAEVATTQNRQGTFFVAPNGRDSWSGALAEPNRTGTDGPFATLGRARDAVREWKSRPGGQAKSPIHVSVRGGKYFLNEPVVFTSGDSGAQESPIVYAAYPGEKPVVSGGRRITGWQPYKDKILQASVPEAKGGRWKFRQLFLDGQRQVRARYPNLGSGDQWRKGWLSIEGAAEPRSFTAFRYKAGSFPRHWAKPTQGEVFTIINWGYTTLAPIKAIDEATRSITLTRGVRDFRRPPWVTPQTASSQVETFHTDFDNAIPQRFFVENLLEELDQPGEWCLDTDEGKVFFWPPQGPIQEHETVAPVLACLVDLRGASWLTLSGFTFTETVNGGDNMHRFGLEGTGAMFPVEDRTYCGEAVHLKDAEHCRLVGNHFLAVGGNAVYLEGHNFRNVVQGNEIAYAGHCGVVLIGTRERPRGVVQHPLGNEVTDNHIHHCGVFDKVAAGVFCGVSDANVIGHNLIEQVPHHAINLGNHGYGRNIVEYNDIRYACQETYDNAAINCWMENDRTERGEERSGHIIRYNRIADISGAITFGIYLDNFSSNCSVYGNLLVRCGLSGVRINGGRNNLIENNIIVGCPDPVGCWPATVFWPNMKGFMTGNRLERNIISDYSTIYRIDTDQADMPQLFGVSDYNLFFGARSGRELVGIGPRQTIPLVQWKATGYEEHSVVADPRFVDPAHDDYRLKPESPAFAFGFQGADFTRVGPRPGP